jgi:hypothetical protein
MCFPCLALNQTEHPTGFRKLTCEPDSSRNGGNNNIERAICIRDGRIKGCCTRTRQRTI